MARRLDDNLILEEKNGTHYIACAHCGHLIAEQGENFYERLACYEGPPTEAGPQIWPDPSVYVDRQVVFRQYYCPNCYIAFLTQVVPSDHPVLVDKQLSGAQ